MKATKSRTPRSKTSKPKLVRETYGSATYEYYPLGQHVVAALGVCGGRPTFKYTRLEVSIILALIASGDTVEEVVKAYSLSRLTPDAVAEAIRLAELAPPPLPPAGVQDKRGTDGESHPFDSPAD